MASALNSRLGDYIRRQRELQELSLQQLADLVGISNPCLRTRGMACPRKRGCHAGLR
jgi:hypothetical protein